MLMNRSNHDIYRHYDPFRMMEEMERRFWSDNTMAEIRTDIRDEGENYLLEADLPGFKKEDIHVDLEGDCLTICAERHSEYEDEDKKQGYVRCERSYGSYRRSFDVSGVNTDRIDASFADGVLKLTLPKQTRQEADSRSIAIE